MEIELSVKISEEDFVNINKEIHKKSKKTMIHRFLLILVWFIISGMLFGIVIDILEDRFMDNLLLNIYGICFSLFIIFGFPQLRIYNYKKFYRKNVAKLETIHYNIDEEFINVKTHLSESKTSWQAIIQVQELTKWFLLRPNTISFHALPKNQLNPSQQEWLRDKIAKK